MKGQFRERRQTPRTDLKQVVRIRPFDPQLPPEYCTTFNISEAGLYLATSASHYVLGMNVYVTGDFQPGSPMNHSLTGCVVRIEELESGQFGVAIKILSGR
jgi:hypothetical protein